VRAMNRPKSADDSKPRSEAPLFDKVSTRWCTIGPMRNDTRSTVRCPMRKHPMLSLGGILALAAVLVLTAAAPRSSSSALHLRTIADVPLAGGSSRFDYQSLDQDRRLLFISHLGASMVTVFNTGSNAVVKNISNIPGVHGVLVIPKLHRVYASATDANQIDVIDERSLRVEATIPGGTYPDGIAYDPVHHEVFVSDEGGGTDTVITTRTNRRVATIPLGGEAGNTQYDSVLRRIFVDVQTRNQLVAINPATNHIIARYALPGCQHDHSLLLDARSRLAFVACDGNAKLLVVDLRTMNIDSVQAVGADPDVLALDSRLHRLFVAGESGILSVFDEHGQTVRKVGEGFVAREAHSVTVDSRTHRLYLPLENVRGQPVLRIAMFRRP
jgi:YVTN family beta-propeller protein